MKKIFFTTILIIILSSACSAAPTPTPTNVEDVQGTAFASALTVIAETYAAQLTETSMAPTDTPSFTPTTEIVNTPTVKFTDTPEPIFTLTASPTATTDDAVCNNVLGTSAANRHIRLRLWNKTKYSVSLTIYLNKTTFGDCGYRAYTLTQGSQILISDLPFGCYNATAFINDPKGTRSVFASGCANNTDVWSFEVQNDIMYFSGP